MYKRLNNEIRRESKKAMEEQMDELREGIESLEKYGKAEEMRKN